MKLVTWLNWLSLHFDEVSDHLYLCQVEHTTWYHEVLVRSSAELLESYFHLPMPLLLRCMLLDLPRLFVTSWRFNIHSVFISAFVNFTYLVRFVNWIEERTMQFNCLFFSAYTFYSLIFFVLCLLMNYGHWLLQILVNLSILFMKDVTFLRALHLFAPPCTVVNVHVTGALILLLAMLQCPVNWCVVVVFIIVVIIIIIIIFKIIQHWELKEWLTEEKKINVLTNRLSCMDKTHGRRIIM